MANLKLITTENFGNIACDFYRNMNDDVLLTREQIGLALEYSNPRVAIKNIHLKHKDRLDDLSIRIKLGGSQNKAPLISKSEEQERVYYTERGIMEICRWSRQPKANQFMDWCWDIIEAYRNNEISNIANTIATMQQDIKSLQQDIDSMKEQKQKPEQKKTFSLWTNRMFPKYDFLMEYFDIDRKELYRNLFMEFENRYPEIDLLLIQEDYCTENNLNSCYTMEAIEHNKEIRMLFEDMVDELLDRYKLDRCDREHSRKKTIFV